MSPVRLDKSKKRALITIDRPHKKNAINREVMERLEEIVHELESDSSMRAVILTAAGDSFVSGGDLAQLATMLDKESGAEMSRYMQSILGRFERLPCPTICAINGDAYGGGCELALACDMRVIQSGSKLAFRQTAMGLTPGWGGGQRLLRLVGRSRAMLLLATAESFEAEEALSFGLVDRISDSALEEAERIASRIRERSQRAVENTKRALSEGRDLPLDAAIAREAELFQEVWGEPDHIAQTERFLSDKPS